VTRLISLRAALPAAALVLLLSSCTATGSASSADDPSSSPVAEAGATETATAMPTEPAPTPVDPAEYAAVEIGEGVVFVSPSKNLRCGIVTFDGAEYLWGCRIDEKAWESPSGSPDDYCADSQVRCGWGIEAMGDGEPHPRNRGDVAFESEYREDSRVLRSEASITYAGITCVSQDESIECANGASGHGFAISEATADIW
jgi:hypothetical protein